jgi:hypothetical protein
MRQSYVLALKAVGLLYSTSKSNGAFDGWMHCFGERDIHIDEQLGLEGTSRRGKAALERRSNARRAGSETTTID